MGKVKGYYLDHIDDNFDPYEGLSKEEIELFNSVPPCSSMTSVESDDESTEIDLNRDVPDIVWEPEYLGDR